MPDPVTHHYFGNCVISSLEDEITNKLDMNIFERALQGPDPWSTIGFYGGKNKQYAKRSNIMHKQKTGDFLITLTKAAQGETALSAFSLLAGFICHYCLDRTAHPYVICKSGDFDGSAETYHLRSGHVRLERGIDSYFIRSYYRKKPWHFCIPKEIFKLKQYPESLRKTIDDSLYQVYGWKNGFDLFNRSLKDEALFYSLMQDPLGIVHYLLKPLSRGKTNFCIFSYFHRDIKRETDYLNENRVLWHHPFATEKELNDSFFDLFQKAVNDAVNMILGAYREVFLGEEISLDELYGNINYSTGLDCGDKRNENKPLYEPI